METIQWLSERRLTQPCLFDRFSVPNKFGMHNARRLYFIIPFLPLCNKYYWEFINLIRYEPIFKRPYSNQFRTRGNCSAYIQNYCWVQQYARCQPNEASIASSIIITQKTFFWYINAAKPQQSHSYF